MLSALSLLNYQAHKETHIDFDPHITAIVGSSDSGKTSILRALYWVLQNKPAGTQMVSFWNRKKDGTPKAPTQASLIVDDHTVTRVRAPERNGYDWDGQELSAIGRDVPEQITSYLNLSDINISRQFDQHFLLAESAGEVARRLNELVRLDIIDKTLSQVEKDKRAAKKEADAAGEAISLHQKEIDALAWTDRAEFLIPLLEGAEKSKTDCDEASRKLTTARSSLQTYVDTIKSIGCVVEAGRGLIDEISGHLADVEQFEGDIDKLLSIKRGLEEAELGALAFGLVRPAKRALEFLAESMEEAEGIDKKLSDLKEMKEALKKVDSDIEDLYIEVEKAKKELPKTCPTCGASLEEDVCVN